MINEEVNAYEDDCFSRRTFAERLESFLLIEHDFASESLVVSLNAPFGAGKTTFLRMWANDLKKRRQNGRTAPLVLRVNAWEDDFCGEPLLSIITGLIREVEAAGLREKQELSRLREAAKDFAWFGLGLANNMVSKITGIDPLAAAEFAEQKGKARKATAPDFLKLFEEKSSTLKSLKDHLKTVLGSNQPQTFVIVDELDRCRPDYAIHYLETIKHVFDIHGLVFILAMDYDQMVCSARCLFGQDLNAEEYFRKFIQRSFSLPNPDAEGINSVTNSYTDKYLRVKGKRDPMLNLGSAKKNVTDLIKCTNMLPRQIQELFRMLGHVTGALPGDARETSWTIGASVIFIATLQITNRNLYHKVGRGACSLLELGKYIQSMGLRNSRWWFCLFASGQHDEDSPQVDLITSTMVGLGYIDTSKAFDFQKEFQQFFDGWDYSTGKRIQQLYQAIETASSFGYKVAPSPD